MNTRDDLKKKILNYNKYEIKHLLNLLYKNNYISDINIYEKEDNEIIEIILLSLLKKNNKDIKKSGATLDLFLRKMIDEYYVSLLLSDRIFSMHCYIHLSNNKVFNENEKYIFKKERGVMQNAMRFNNHSSLSQTNTILKATNDVIDFLNSIDCTKSNKDEYLTYLLNKYNQSKEENTFDWLNCNDKELAKWCIDYFSKNETIDIKCRNKPALFRYEKTFNIIIPAIFHSLEISDAEKKLFLINMRKAWGQKKYRTKIKNEKKKTLSLVVDETIDKRLKKLSKEFDVPVNKIVSMMTIYLADKYTEIKALEEEKKNNKRKQLHNLM